MPRIRAFLSFWLLVGCFSLPLSAQTEKLSFENLPLSQALKSVAQEYGIIVAFPERSVATYTVTLTLDETLPIEAQLQRLLENTPLLVKQIDEGQFVISAPRPLSTRTRSLPIRKTYAVRGSVLDADNNEPLAQATIHIPGTPYGTYSNEEGHFLLAGLPAIYDSIEVRYMGYLTQRHPFVLHQSISVRLTLDPKQLADVVIEEGSEQVVTVADAASKLTLNPRRIQALSGLGEPDILRALQYLPGIQSVDESASGLHIRGGRPEENMVLFDGITIYQPGHLFGNFSAFNPQAIKELTVQRGGFDARYGGRVSGVIDIQGRPEQMQKAQGEIGANLMTANAYVQTPFWKNKGAVMLAVRRSSSNVLESGIYSAMTQRAIDSLHLAQQSSGFASLQNIPTFQFTDINAKIALRPTDKDLISLSAYWADDALQYDWRDRISPEEWFTQTERTLLENKGLSLNWKRQWNARHLSKFTAAWSSFDNLFKFQQAYNLSPEYKLGWDQGNGIKDFSVRLDQEFVLDEKNRFEYGVHATQFQLDSMLNFIGDGDLKEFHRSSQLLSTYAQYNWQPDARWSFTLGGRMEYFEGTSKWYTSPRLSFRYQLNAKLYLKGVWGQYYQYLNRTELGSLAGLIGEYWTLANDQTIPVLGSEHFILGAAYENNDWLIDAELYQKNLSGLISYLDAAYEIQNFEPILYTDGAGLARGLDLMVQKKLGAYTGWVSYSLSEVTYRFNELQDGQAFAASHDQRHQFSMVNLLEQGPWDFSLNWTFASGRPFTPAERIAATQLIDGSERYYIDYGAVHSARMPAYHRLDASATLNLPTWKERFGGKVGISIFNVYNRRNLSNVLYRVRQGGSQKAQPSILRLEKNLLGITPNLFVQLHF